MSPTSFFLLTLLLVLVTEAAARGSRERFSQSAEEYSSESSEVSIVGGGGSGGSSSTHDKHSQSRNSWCSFKAKSPKSVIREEVYEEKKFKENSANSDDGDERRSLSAGEIERSYTRKKEKQRFAQEMAK